MAEVTYKIDYNDLNELLREISNEDLELNKENANERIRKLYFERFKQVKQLDAAITDTVEYRKKQHRALQLETDAEIFHNATAILLNLFINENNVLTVEYSDLLSELIVNVEIQQILKEELPSLREISEYIHSKDNVTVDTTDMIGMIFETIDNMDFEKLDDVEFFKILDKAFKEFYEDGEVDEMFD